MKLFDIDIERVTTRYGRFHVATRDSTIGRALKLYGEWAEDEIERCARLLTDGDAIIDVGANIGTHAIALAWRFPSSPIYAFEPQPLAFALLSGNVLASGRSNVRPFCLGCSDAEQMIRVKPDYDALDWNVGAFSIPGSEGGGVPLSLVRLDDHPFARRVQFMKVDVEGMEEAVLRGARALIERDRPIVFFEVLELSRLASIHPFFDALGYELRWLQTEAYNPENFCRNTENIWSRGETGVLALPEPNDARAVQFPLVTGSETEIPVRHYS